jgi:hypothetical protein
MTTRSPLTSISILGRAVWERLTRKCLCFVGGDRSQVLQIALVSNQHDDNVLVGVVSQFLEPPSNILISRVLGNVVNQKGTNSSSVVCGCDLEYQVRSVEGTEPSYRSITLLTSCTESAQTPIS